MEERCSQFFDKIKTSRNLPSLPQILLKLIKLCNSRESKIKDIFQIINKDPSLTAKVMSIAAFSDGGPSKRLTNIEQAVNALGKNAIKNIAISASGIQAFHKVEKNNIVGLKVFWRHSIRCAVLSELIAQKVSYPFPDEAFLTGLLHDIGKLVLWANLPGKSTDILNSSKNQPDLILSAEARHNATHSEVGSWLIRRWGLQSFMADAVHYHHESSDRIRDALPLIKIIYVGNALCSEINHEQTDKCKIAKTIFGFETSEIDKIILIAEEKVRKTAQSLDIDIESLEDSRREVTQTDCQRKEELIKTIQGITLLQGTLNNLLKAPDEDCVFNVVQQGLDILFDVKSVLFFEYEPERDVLKGRCVSSNKRYDLINEITIPFQKGKSLLTKSLLQRDTLDSFRASINKDISIIDEQIIRLIDKDGILCLPMATYSQYAGVIVLGLTEADFSNLNDKMRLLEILAEQAGDAIQRNRLEKNQAKLLQDQHSNTTSAIARKVVHEVNTPLSIIKNYLAVIKSKLSDDVSFQDELRIINEEVDSVALIIRELSDVSVQQVWYKDPLDLNELLSKLIKIYQRSHIISPNINTHLELDPSLPKVKTDKNRMKQVFSNLILNAAEAMPGGGNLNIRSRHAFNYIDDKVNSSIIGTLGHAEITISDDGPGLGDTVKASLFNPYVTSKGMGHSGLGLSIAYGNVKKLKGTITCESDSQNGTCFKIVIPVTFN